MIKIDIDNGKYDLDDELRTRITDRFGGLDEYMNTLEAGRVTISWKGGTNEQTHVSAEVWGGGHKFEASDTDWKAAEAINSTRGKLEVQITGKHARELDKRDHRTHK